MEGFILIHRQICENQFYFLEPFGRVQAWIDLLLLANHRASDIMIRGIRIKLSKGQLAYSQETLAVRWKRNPRTVKKFLDEFKKAGMLDYKTDRRTTTIITILNWERFQAPNNKNAELKRAINKGENEPLPFTSTELNAELNAEPSTDRQQCKNNNIIESSKNLLKEIKKQSSYYSVINRFKKSLGESKLVTILSGCQKRNIQFDNENVLASYLQKCIEPEKLTDKLNDINFQLPGWM